MAKAIDVLNSIRAETEFRIKSEKLERERIEKEEKKERRNQLKIIRELEKEEKERIKREEERKRPPEDILDTSYVTDLTGRLKDELYQKSKLSILDAILFLFALKNPLSVAEVSVGIYRQFNITNDIGLDRIAERMDGLVYSGHLIKLDSPRQWYKLNEADPLSSEITFVCESCTQKKAALEKKKQLKSLKNELIEKGYIIKNPPRIKKDEK